MGPTAGSSGLALIIGISEGTLGGLVGVQAFFAAADHVAVWGARVKSMKLFGYPHFPSYSIDYTTTEEKRCVRLIKRGSVPPRGAPSLGSTILHKVFLKNGSN